jgi:hypothetical protein
MVLIICLQFGSSISPARAFEPLPPLDLVPVASGTSDLIAPDLGAEMLALYLEGHKLLDRFPWYQKVVPSQTFQGSDQQDANHYCLKRSLQTYYSDKG